MATSTTCPRPGHKQGPKLLSRWDQLRISIHREAKTQTGDRCGPGSHSSLEANQEFGWGRKCGPPSWMGVQATGRRWLLGPSESHCAVLNFRSSIRRCHTRAEKPPGAPHPTNKTQTAHQAYETQANLISPAVPSNHPSLLLFLKQAKHGPGPGTCQSIYQNTFLPTLSTAGSFSAKDSDQMPPPQRDLPGPLHLIRCRHPYIEHVPILFPSWRIYSPPVWT